MTTTTQPVRTGLSLPFIRMSSAGNCRRQIGYGVLGYPESDPTPGTGRNVMELGAAAEAILIHRLRDDGWEIELTRFDDPQQMGTMGVIAQQNPQQLQVTLDDPPRVGHPDGRCRHPEFTNGLWVLLECKGMNAFQFRRFQRDGFQMSHPQYVGQVAQYARALHERGLVVDPCAAVVAALDRDMGRWDAQRVRWEPGVYEERTHALAEAWSHIAQHELPGRDYDGTTWHCSPRYCRWSSLCWQGIRPIADPEPVDGTLHAEELPEAIDLLEQAQLWREGKALEAEGKTLQDDARNAFDESLKRHGGKRLLADGVTVTLVHSTRHSWIEAKVRAFLTEAQIAEAQKSTPVTSLRVVDTHAPANL